MTLPLRRTAALAVLALATAPLAACGSSSDNSATDSPSPTPSSAVSSSTGDTGSPTAPATGTSSSAAPSGATVSAADFTALFSKALDAATTAKVALQVQGPAAVSGSGVEDFTTNPPSAQLTLTGSGHNTGVELVDGFAYIGDGTGKYLKVDLKQALGGNTQLFDPKATLPLLEKSITKAVHVGPSTQDGQTLDEYDVTLDATSYLKALSAGVASSSPQAGLPSTLVEKVFFDSQGRTAKLIVDEGAKFGVSTITYSDWGTAVHITPPPPSQIESIPGGVPTATPTS